MAVHRDNPRGGSRDDSENVGSELGKTHKSTAQAGYHLGYMLTKRKLSKDHIDTAISHLEEALDRAKKLRRRMYGDSGSSVRPGSR